MIQVRWASERGTTQLRWLKSFHSFSFGDYYDSQHMGFHSLRVINEDTVTPNGGFPSHSHSDMEIITYILEGALQHKDSLGKGSVIKAGDVQRMSAGTGITHSEFNASATESVHFLQIWIVPRDRGVEPSYEQKSLDINTKTGQLLLAVAPEKADGALLIHQDARIYVGKLMPHEKVKYSIDGGRKVWLQVGEGAVRVHGHALMTGDGAAISDESNLELEADAISQVLLFDLN